LILRWREFGGRPGSRLFERLHGSIERYRDRSESINIGLTTDPTLLWSEQRHAGWKEMVVIYSTSTRDFADAVEEELLARGWGASFTSWNYELIGERLPGSYTRYYVYVKLA